MKFYENIENLSYFVCFFCFLFFAFISKQKCLEILTTSQVCHSILSISILYTVTIKTTFRGHFDDIEIHFQLNILLGFIEGKQYAV